MKRILCLILSVGAIFGMFKTSYAKTGDILGYAKYTDISAYINHYPIKSYNINDYTAIVAEDLNNYGFDVVWDETNRTLSVTRGSTNTIEGTSNVYKYSYKAGQNSIAYVETDVVTYLNGQKVESFNIGGQTCIYIDALSVCGEVSWVPEARAIKLWISDLPVKDYAAVEEVPTIVMYSSDGRTIIVEKSEVEAYKAVGWYTEPVYTMCNGSYSGGGTQIPGSIYFIGQWHAIITNATANSMNLAFGQSESDYHIDNMILYRQENGSYYGIGYSTWGTSYITIYLETPQCISLTVSGDADQIGTKYLYK
ncbi:MAG: hypothetical protein PUF72_08020 [Clostridiales bacterium]|nr:hypothetical protein [Clostridiales bacterium]